MNTQNFAKKCKAGGTKVNDINKFEERKRNRKKKKEKKRFVFKVLSFLIILFLCATFIFFLLPGFEKISFFEYHADKIKTDIGVVFGEDIVPTDIPIVYKNDCLYFPVDFIKENIDEYIYWDKAEEKITITTNDRIIKMQTDELTYYVNDEPMELMLPIYNIDTIAYMPSDILSELYNLNIQYYENSSIVTIDKKNIEMTFTYSDGMLSPLRYEPNRQSPIVEWITDDEKIIVFGSYGKNNEYFKARNSLGYIGYIKKSDLNADIEKISPENNNTEQNNNTVLWKPSNGKINLTFDAISNVSANSTDLIRTTVDGLDVLVPTWFSFEKNENGGTNGKIKNIADKSYVSWAHKNGYQVWGLITDNFNSTVCHDVVSSSENREYVIKQLLAFVSLYDLDGINIDFEQITKEDAPAFIQFMRELSVYLKKEGVVLSVDVYIPRAWTKHYNRKALGEIVDYFIVMGYDQHTKSSETSGSVATIDWSEESITATYEEGVPYEKLILGVPFYTRIWQEDSNGNIVDVWAVGMENALKYIKEKGADTVWLDDVKQNYGEAFDGTYTYKVWLEDVQSMEERVKLVEKYNIAGIGSWRRGFETDDIWVMLKKHLKK